MNAKLTFQQFVEEIARKERVLLSEPQRELLRMAANGKRLYINISRHGNYY